MVIIRATGQSLKYAALALYVRCLKRFLSFFSGVPFFIVTALLMAGGIAAGPAQALDRGAVTVWGDNTYNQTAIPTGLTGVTAIAAGGFHSLALKSDGTVVAWGYPGNGSTTIPTSLAGVTAIAAGDSHSLALKRDGTVTGWGVNDDGQTTVPASLTDVIAIGAGYFHSLALKKDGTVVAWGDNDRARQTTIPAGLTGVTAIAAGSFHNLALKSDGTVVGWGSELDGLANIPAGLTGVTAVAAGGSHSLALKRDGTVVGWGNNDYGQTTIPASLTDVIAIAAGYGHSLAVKKDGTVVGWGDYRNGQTTIPTDLGVVTAIAAGGYHSLAANLAAPSRYTFSGFLEPVNNPGVLNLGKAGRTYPFKWQLKDASDAFITRLSVVSSITSKAVQCGAFSPFPVNSLETESAGASELRFDATSNLYIYNWKAPSPGCYSFFVTLDNGQVLLAYFYFVK